MELCGSPWAQSQANTTPGEQAWGAGATGLPPRQVSWRASAATQGCTRRPRDGAGGGELGEGLRQGQWHLSTQLAKGRRAVSQMQRGLQVVSSDGGLVTSSTLRVQDTNAHTAAPQGKACLIHCSSALRAHYWVSNVKVKSVKCIWIW